MYSQCPDCQTRFRVTAEALRAARGTVRCGRCGSAFDALERLSDTLPDAREADSVATASDLGDNPNAAAAMPAAAGMHFSAEDLERVFVDSRDWQAQFGAPAPQLVAERFESVDAGDEAQNVVVDEDTHFEDITLEGERIRIEAAADPGSPETDADLANEFAMLRDVPEAEFPQDDETEMEELIKQLTGEFEVQRIEPAPNASSVDEAPDDTPPVEEVIVLADAGAADTLAAPAAAVPAAPAGPGQPWRWQPPPQPTDELPDLDPPAKPLAWRTMAWAAGSLVLAVVLATQVIHRYRQDLVRHPLLGSPLRAVYERLGIPLTPNWNLDAFELRQWGSESAATDAGRMVVRASLTNRAAFAQPHPILRLELDDRFGGTVATRDFEPADYLKNPSQATRLISAGATTEAELLLADPGVDAVGYRLDICLRESATLLRCARGPG